MMRISSINRLILCFVSPATKQIKAILFLSQYSENNECATNYTTRREFLLIISLALPCAECADGRYGVGCQGVCDCDAGATCDKVTGSCLCGLGRTGSKCDRVCESGRFGPNCGHTCQCGEHSDGCDPVSGCCSCRPGYYGPQCNLGKYIGL